MNRDILAAIQEQMPTFSKGQKLIANFILSSYDKAAFMTASKLGKTVKVSESTVVRFAAELGYDGYPAMQRTLQEMIRNKLTSVQRIEVSDDRIGNHDILSMVMQSDMDKVRLTLEQIDRAAFDGAVSDIVAAKRIYILGVRSAGAISTFLAFYFNLIFENVTHVAASSASEVFEQLLRVGPDDVVIRGPASPAIPSAPWRPWPLPTTGGRGSSPLPTRRPLPCLIPQTGCSWQRATWCPLWIPWSPLSVWSTP